MKLFEKLPVARYAIYLLIVPLTIVGTTYARYASTVSGTASARAAKFDTTVTVSDVDGEEIDLIALPLLLNATVKLSDAENCAFDDNVGVWNVTVRNNSEVVVRAAITKITEQTEKGILWCLFQEEDLAAKSESDGGGVGYEDIMAKLGYSSLKSVPDIYSNLEDVLKWTNADTVEDWSNTVIGIGDSKTLMIIFWAEYDGVSTYNAMAEGLKELEETIDIQFAVSQIN